MAQPDLPTSGRLVLCIGLSLLTALFIFLPWSGWVQRDQQWRQHLATLADIQRRAVLQAQQALTASTTTSPETRKALHQLDHELSAGLALIRHLPVTEETSSNAASDAAISHWQLDAHSRPEVREWLQAGLLPKASNTQAHQVMKARSQQFLLTRVALTQPVDGPDPTTHTEILVWRDISANAAEHRQLQNLLLGRWLLAFGATLLLLGALLVIFQRSSRRQALRQAETEREREILLQRFDKLTRHLPGMVYEYRQSSSGRDWLPYVSKGVHALYGVPSTPAGAADQLLHHTHPDDIKRIRQELAASASSLDVWRSRYRINHPQLGERWLASFASPERLPNGDTAWHGFTTDITEERQRNEEIRQTRSFLRAVIDAATEVAVITTDPNGLITLFNSGAEKLLGYRAEEMVGKHTPEHFHLPSEMISQARILEQELGYPVSGIGTFISRARDGQPETRNWTFVCKDGSQRQVTLTVSRIADQDNQLIGYLGVATDITEVMLATCALEESESHFRSMVSSLPGAVYRCQNDEHWAMDYLSEEIVNITGYPASEFIDNRVRSYASIVHPDDLEITNRTIGKVRQHESFDITYRILHADGHVVWVKEKGRGEYDSNGQLLWWSGFIWDATEQKRIDDMKSQFVSAVSHELRTPLTAISGSLALINSGVLGALPAAMQKLLHIAHDNSKHLNALINDLLDMDKLAAGKMRLSMQLQVLSPILLKALENNRSYAEQFGVSLVAGRIDSAIINIDAQRLEQILANYLSNAAKFSQPGEKVLLEAVLESGKVRISVTDHGVGIPSQYHGVLFQKFSQVDATDTRQRGGTGLGLAICRELATNMHGEVGFHSTPGEGSSFWCLFDAEPVNEE